MKQREKGLAKKQPVPSGYHPDTVLPAWWENPRRLISYRLLKLRNGDALVSTDGNYRVERGLDNLGVAYPVYINGIEVTRRRKLEHLVDFILDNRFPDLLFVEEGSLLMEHYPPTSLMSGLRNRAKFTGALLLKNSLAFLSTGYRLVTRNNILVRKPLYFEHYRWCTDFD